MQPDTVAVAHPDNPGEPMIINKSGFDPAVHKLYEPPAVEPPKPEGDQAPPEGDDEPPTGEIPKRGRPRKVE